MHEVGSLVRILLKYPPAAPPLPPPGPRVRLLEQQVLGKLCFLLEVRKIKKETYVELLVLETGSRGWLHVNWLEKEIA